jgi:hypothetical protein
MMILLSLADGLLLLSASHAAIPSKLFEYLPLCKPIFASTSQSSAVWKIGESVKYIHLTDYMDPAESVARSFIDACQFSEDCHAAPPQYSEQSISTIFAEHLPV